MADSQDGYILAQVYTNLNKMLIRRGVKLAAEPLASSEMVQKINGQEYITILGERGNDLRGKAKVIVILIAPNSRYAKHTADIVKLLKLAPKPVDSGDHDQPARTDVIFVAQDAFSIHIKKGLNEQRSESLSIEDYSYSIFLVELPLHTCVPEHIIPPPEEVEEFLRLHVTTKDRLQKILMTDPQAVWLGLRPGMVVRINRLSETAGTAVAYRLCVK